MINAKRSPKAPTSLTAKKSWRGEDVLSQLHADFFEKCYLTEVALPPGGFEVDHRHPRGAGGDPWDWENLYPAHPHANLRRPQTWPEGGLLHPDGRDDVEARLEQTIELEDTGIYCRFMAADVADEPAVNTAKELDHLHNTRRLPGRLKARDLRNEIERRLTRMLLQERDVLIARRDRSPTDPERRRLEQRFQRFISRERPFTALLRSQVHTSLRDLFD